MSFYPLSIGAVWLLLVVGLWSLAWPEDLPWTPRRRVGALLLIVAVLLARGLAQRADLGF